jgi:hypothetical protein
MNKNSFMSSNEHGTHSTAARTEEAVQFQNESAQLFNKIKDKQFRAK